MKKLMVAVKETVVICNYVDIEIEDNASDDEIDAIATKKAHGENDEHYPQNETASLGDWQIIDCLEENTKVITVQ